MPRLPAVNRAADYTQFTRCKPRRSFSDPGPFAVAPYFAHSDVEGIPKVAMQELRLAHTILLSEYARTAPGTALRFPENMQSFLEVLGLPLQSVYTKEDISQQFKRILENCCSCAPQP